MVSEIVIIIIIIIIITIIIIVITFIVIIIIIIIIIITIIIIFTHPTFEAPCKNIADDCLKLLFLLFRDNNEIMS